MISHIKVGIIIEVGGLISLKEPTCPSLTTPDVVVLVEALALFNDYVWEAILKLSKDARLHVLLCHLLAQGFLQALRVDLKDEFVLPLWIVHPLLDLCHKIVELLLV